MMRILQSLAAALVVAAAAPASADLTVVSKLSADGKTETATSYLSADKARIVQPGGHEMIFDGTKGEMTLVDNNKKQYFVMTKQEMEDAAAQMQQQMQQANAKMEDAMKNVPPEMREKMKSMVNVGGMMASGVEVKKAPGGRQIAGYKCENWTLTVGEMSKTEECLSTDVPYPTGAWESFRSMQNILHSMGPGMNSASALQEKTKDLKGFPSCLDHDHQRPRQHAYDLQRSAGDQEGRHRRQRVRPTRRLQEGRLAAEVDVREEVTTSFCPLHATGEYTLVGLCPPVFDVTNAVTTPDCPAREASVSRFRSLPHLTLRKFSATVTGVAAARN